MGDRSFAMPTLLFFDDFYLSSWENLQRHVGKPELVLVATFEDPDHYLASGYPTVYRTESGAWRCIYTGKPLNEPPPQRYPLILENNDAIERKMPDLSGRYPWQIANTKIRSYQ